MKTLSRESYSKRIEKMLDYLNEHIDSSPDLYCLAQEAYLSPFHFHRIYVAMMGESVTDTIRRRRLHRATVQLLGSKRLLTKLAPEAGYSNMQAFSRVF